MYTTNLNINIKTDSNHKPKSKPTTDANANDDDNANANTNNSANTIAELVKRAVAAVLDKPADEQAAMLNLLAHLH
eukprot:CAMPEP_0119540634 /NCGR_PEP_ID=MMETSP1344-20130328/52460_1 /TAXON_ID=236787 /ORGANISM="Florenciella parvula, Strain CCMP2471" /LENGTH=75 /DNA_ID=CAMNT_0007584431 /DNA_START=137 /DNA_END=362 /DNA_ORIENTATION=-